VARLALAAAIPCIVIVGLVVVLRQRQSGPPARRIVIVLPFKNGSGDPKEDYLARGVSVDRGGAVENAGRERVFGP